VAGLHPCLLGSLQHCPDFLPGFRQKEPPGLGSGKEGGCTGMGRGGIKGWKGMEIDEGKGA